MPKPTLPPTPQSTSLPYHPPPNLSPHDFTFTLPPPAMETNLDKMNMYTPPSPPPTKRRRTTMNSASTAPAAVFTAPSTPGESRSAARGSRPGAGTRKASSSSSSSSSSASSTQLPPPPTRARKIIQMAPKPAVSRNNTTTTTSSSNPTDTNTTPSSSSSTTTTTTSKPSSKTKVTRKTAHSLIERRRRSKMNEEFAVLKSLVPACKGVEMHKLAVLQAGIEYVRYLERCVDELRERRNGGERAESMPLSVGSSGSERGRSREAPPREMRGRDGNTSPGCGSASEMPTPLEEVEGLRWSLHRHVDLDQEAEEKRREEAERAREAAEMEWQQRQWGLQHGLQQIQHFHLPQQQREQQRRLPSISPLLDATAGATLLLMADEEVGRRYSAAGGSVGAGLGLGLGLGGAGTAVESRNRGLSVGDLLSS